MSIDLCHMSHDTQGGGEHCLRISGPQLFWVGTEGDLKIWGKKGEGVNELMNDIDVCRTAPDTPVLFKIYFK